MKLPVSCNIPENSTLKHKRLPHWVELCMYIHMYVQYGASSTYLCVHVRR